MVNRFWSGLCMVLLLSGCGWDGTATRPNDFSQLTSITISAVYPTIANGTSTKLTAIGHYSGGFSRDITDKVAWSSASPTAADFKYTTAPNKNRVTGNAPGSSIVTATLDGVSATYTVTVSNATVQTVMVTPATASVAKGLAVQFTASGLFSDSTTQDLTFDAVWGTTPGTFASVSNDPASKGLATSSAVGTESITATFGTFPAPPATLTVTAAVLQLITVTSTIDPLIVVGISTAVPFTATGTYSDKSTGNITSQVTWESSQTSVATFDSTNSGIATTKGAGTTIISASLGGVSGTKNLTQTLKTLSITPASLTLTASASGRFKTTATFFDNTTQDVTATSEWTSSPTSVATVNNTTDKGLVNGVAAGTATITATYKGLSASPVTVTVQ
ncbi:MAG: Ig-like domain-containing protein [Desulfuromonadaceae bacterium]